MCFYLYWVFNLIVADVTLYCVKGTQVNIVGHIFLFACFCEEKINVDHDMKLPKQRKNHFI